MLMNLENTLENFKFKQIRFIEWIKTNPQPINSKTNSREIAISAVKDKQPTFHSEYDNGIYKYPMAASKNKFHSPIVWSIN